MLFVQISATKPQWEQVCERYIMMDGAVHIGDDHAQMRGKFIEHLPTNATWRTARTGDNGYRHKIAHTFADGFDQRGAFGTNARRVGGIFDITPGEYVPILCQKRRPNRIMRIGGVSPLADGDGLVYQLLYLDVGHKYALIGLGGAMGVIGIRRKGCIFFGLLIGIYRLWTFMNHIDLADSASIDR